MEALKCFSELDASIQAAAFIAYMVFEAWLGRTPKLKSSSTIELVANIAVAIVARLMRRKNV